MLCAKPHAKFSPSDWRGAIFSDVKSSKSTVLTYMLLIGMLMAPNSVFFQGGKKEVEESCFGFSFLIIVIGL